MSGDSKKSKKFPLTFYGITRQFPYGATKAVILEYIKDAKGGSGGTFDAVNNNGSKDPFLGTIFEEDEDIIGYEFVPKDEPAAAAAQGVTKEDNSIEPLYEPSDPPSSVKKDDIDKYQRDDTYFSPCSNAFVLAATRLAYEQIPPAIIQDAEMVNLAETFKKDILAVLNESNAHSLGYCFQTKMTEAGVTALLTANLEKCYSHYCSLLLQLQLQEPAMQQLQSKRTYVMHQSAITEPTQGIIDVGLFYRFQGTDSPSFFHQCSEALYPMCFIEFTKSSTKSILDKFPQASAYANAMFRMMKFEDMKTWVPLLGVVMSESEFVVKLYSLTIVATTDRFEAKKQWKIAEVVIEKLDLNSASVLRLVHMMAGWIKHCVGFLTSASAKSRARGAFNQHLLLRESNVAFIDQHVFKCYDYRSISDRWKGGGGVRRDPQWYYRLGDLNVETVVEWNVKSTDCLKIIKYPVVEGTHEPIYVKHLVLVMQTLLYMHSQNVVHGDLRFANVIFSKADVSPIYSKLIDFDYSGVDGERVYPERFNLDITDGNRQLEVKPGELLHKHHDVHSFAWMCSQYRPENEDLRASWQTWIDIEGGDLTKGLEWFENISDAEKLVMQPAVPTFRVPRGYQGTGSPHMKVK